MELVHCVNSNWSVISPREATFTTWAEPTRSLGKHCCNDPRMYLFVKCHKIQKWVRNKYITDLASPLATKIKWVLDWSKVLTLVSRLMRSPRQLDNVEQQTSSRGGGANPWWGAGGDGWANIQFGQIFPKTAWNWNGGRASKILLCRSTIGHVAQFMIA